MDSEISIRVATIDDASRLLEIYAPYVKDTAVSFECEVPSLEEFKNRMVSVLKKYPYLVAVSKGMIIGYAYASPFKTRAAYGWSVETSIYVDREFRGNGAGRALYEKLESILKLQNIRLMCACIAYPSVEDQYLTKNSAEFHAHLGFSMVGESHRCAYKFGTWYGMAWMEKSISDADSEVKNVIPFPELGPL